MKNYFPFYAIILALTITSCLNKFNNQDKENEAEKFNPFNFATSEEVILNVKYQNMGGIQASVYFEVYDQMPVEEINNTLVKKDGMLPLYTGTTAKDGTLTQAVSLPTHATKLYIYTPAFYARTLIEASVVNGAANISDISPSKGTKSIVDINGTYNSLAVTQDGWKTFLGDYSLSNGQITAWQGGANHYGYAPKETLPADLAKLSYTDAERANLYAIHTAVINRTKECPMEYRVGKDMHIKEATEIAITYLGSNTPWSSSLGYYYYQEGNAPRSLAEANVIMLFPNTQDGLWATWNGKTPQNAVGIKRGTIVRLKYYPNIANGSKDGVSNIFPSGYRIGFVLASNTWTGRIDRFRDFDHKYRSATTNGLSIQETGDIYTTPRTAIYQHKKSTFFSFEDFKDDVNFSDVVFTIKTSPEDAIDDIPVIDDELKVTDTRINGVHTFEDLWPSRGDYDINDAIVSSIYEKLYDPMKDGKGFYSETYYLKTVQNLASLKNGLGVSLINNHQSAVISLSVEKEIVDGKVIYESVPIHKTEGNVILLTDNIKTHLGKTYKLTLTYPTPIRKDKELGIDPFIWRASGDGIWEVHIPQQAPTPLVDKSYFGKSDDLSDTDKGIYYVRKGLYPFAFFLSGATEKSISKLLDPNNEAKTIETVYPKYTDWVTSGGANNKDWYK